MVVPCKQEGIDRTSYNRLDMRCSAVTLFAYNGFRWSYTSAYDWQVAPSAERKLFDGGVVASLITVSRYGESCDSWALVGPPWQTRENGFLLRINSFPGKSIQERMGVIWTCKNRNWHSKRYPFCNSNLNFGAKNKNNKSTWVIKIVFTLHGAWTSMDAIKVMLLYH